MVVSSCDGAEFLLLYCKHVVNYICVYMCAANVETPLTLAAVNPKPRDLMMTLVNGGAFLDFRNRHGLTAMHIAADCGKEAAIRVSEIVAWLC